MVYVYKPPSQLVLSVPVCKKHFPIHVEMSPKTLEGLTTYSGGWVQYREERHPQAFYATELYHDTSDCCYSTEPCFGTLSNRGMYCFDGCNVEIQLGQVDCAGQKDSRHWIRVTPTDSSDWATDIQAFRTYETLQQLLRGVQRARWLGATSHFRHIPFNHSS